ncbi:MAG: metal ABC transporter ATP-binding protein [Bacteriovoracaceae bacterium]
MENKGHVHIQAKNLGHRFDNSDSRKSLFKEISFELKLGEILGIIGPNGSGKSTLLKIILGLLSPREGEVTWGEKKENLTIAYIPQASTFNHFFKLTVRDILKLCSVQKFDKVLEEFSLTHLIDQFFHLLSGGEKQRTLMAMQALRKPDIWFLDEPNKGLDSEGQSQIYQMLNKIRETTKAPILIIDHNINQTLSLCDQILCLNQTGHYHSPKELLDKDRVNKMVHCEFVHGQESIDQGPIEKDKS